MMEGQMAVSVSGWCRALCGLVLAVMGLQAHAGDPLRIVTEEFPPYNMTQNGKITGLATEVLQAVLKEINIQGTIQSMPWARAYEVAQGPDTVLIYSITRTPAREKLFKWIGVVAPADWCLFSLQGRNIKLNQLDEAKTRQVATVNQDVGEQFLVSKGFAIGQNLQSSAKYEFNYEKLKLGRVDLWVSNVLVASHLARQAGDDPSKVLQCAYPMEELSGDSNSMAFSLKTPDELVARFRAGLETIKKNGTFDALKRKWL
jgi:polar amino acid transport system substrate-binding protein